MREKAATLVKVGATIRFLREQQRLSQEQLASLADLDRTYIGGVERGERNISVLNLCRVARALNVTPSRLLEDITSEES